MIMNTHCKPLKFLTFLFSAPLFLLFFPLLPMLPRKRFPKAPRKQPMPQDMLQNPLRETARPIQAVTMLTKTLPAQATAPPMGTLPTQMTAPPKTLPQTPVFPFCG